jgi:uncharacterized protein YjaG (DUF416 family)
MREDRLGLDEDRSREEENDDIEVESGVSVRDRVFVAVPECDDRDREKIKDTRADRL